MLRSTRFQRRNGNPSTLGGRCSLTPSSPRSLYLSTSTLQSLTLSILLMSRALSHRIPTVSWSHVRFKPALPSLKFYPVYGCSPDPVFYENKPSKSSLPCGRDYNLFRCENPFGTLHGYNTNLGVVDVPATPVGGYVLCPTSGWVLYATTPSAQRGEAKRGIQQGEDEEEDRRRKGRKSHAAP